MRFSAAKVPVGCEAAQDSFWERIVEVAGVSLEGFRPGQVLDVKTSHLCQQSAREMMSVFGSVNPVLSDECPIRGVNKF